MSSQGWRRLYRIIKREARRLPRPKRGFIYSDALIATMFFWAVWHDRPQCWACRRDSYNGLFRPRQLPSVSEFNKRIRSERITGLLDTVFEILSSNEAPDDVCLLDSRPLTVGACSKDSAAKAGRVYGGFARGYRLHALVAENGVVLSWTLTAMNVAESTAARTLLPQAPSGGRVLADANYDRTPLYDCAREHGLDLLARPKKNAGCGHVRQNPIRLAAIECWRQNPKHYQRRRDQVERAFAWQSSFGGGLSPLPAWVRTPPRVYRWVQAKLVINHVRIHERKNAA
jgi:hypothetical protein